MRQKPALLACMMLAAGAFLQPAAADNVPASPSYLDPAVLPDGAVILAPPPPAGSPARTLDQQVFLHSRALKQQDPVRWALAQSDALLDDDHLLASFGCALGVTLDRATAPSLYRLLDRAAHDTRPETDNAKNHFAHVRPYIGNDQPICVARHTSLDQSPSYPSGHTTLGMSVALILTELAPERSTELLARGRTFGESRIVCGVHWLSDVEGGYLNAAALVAVLHSSPAFRANMVQAGREISAARRHPATPPDPAACAAQQDAQSHSLLFQMQP